MDPSTCHPGFTVEPRRSVYRVPLNFGDPKGESTYRVFRSRFPFPLPLLRSPLARMAFKFGLEEP